MLCRPHLKHTQVPALEFIKDRTARGWAHLARSRDLPSPYRAPPECMNTGGAEENLGMPLCITGFNSFQTQMLFSLSW